MAADIEVLERLHTDDFQLINPGGGALSKAEYLGGIASGDIDYLVWEPSSEIAVRLYGEAAAIRYQSHTEIVVLGETIAVENWHTDVYERHDGRWQAVWSHATSIQQRGSAGGRADSAGRDAHSGHPDRVIDGRRDRLRGQVEAIPGPSN